MPNHQLILISTSLNKLYFISFLRNPNGDLSFENIGCQELSWLGDGGFKDESFTANKIEVYFQVNKTIVLKFYFILVEINCLF
jgi:hypothetical protein